jgi:hypothetical protein
MRRSWLCLGLAALTLTTGCAISGAATLPPSIPLASSACGGFHLTVANKTAGPVSVEVNGDSVGSIAAGESTTLVQGLSPEVGRMPWNVVVTRSSDGAALASIRYEAGPDQLLLVTDEGVSPAPGETETAVGC